MKQCSPTVRLVFGAPPPKTFFVLAAIAGTGCGNAVESSGIPDPAASDDGGSADQEASAEAGTMGPGTDAGTDASSVVTTLDAATHSTGPTPTAGLHIEGGKFVYGGRPTRLLGVNHSGSEYQCLSSGIFEGPDADTIANGVLSWGAINTIRVPLNEDCWLGINGVNPQYSGAAYRDAVMSYVAKLHAHGLFTIVDLHWNAPGSFLANGQQPMADADHAIDFWKSVASTMKGDGMTVFDLYNEPYLDSSNAQTSDPWSCWLNGCTVTGGGRGGVSGSWQSAGMQALVDAVRSTGATNVLMVGGLNFSDDLTQWLTHVPNDPLHQVAASLHAYGGGPCAVSSCWSQVLEPIAAQYPIVTGELGEYDCGHSFIDDFLKWADKAGVSYVPWTWNTWDCGSGPSLISDYDGTATAFGEGYRQHLQAARP
jgi:hypothetical protein